MMIEYIDENMKLREILQELQIKTRDWDRWTRLARNPQHAMRIDIKNLYEKLRFKQVVQDLVDRYADQYPSKSIYTHYERDSLDEFWFTYGLWLSRDDIFDCGVNRLGQLDPEYDPDSDEDQGGSTLSGYGGEVESRFDKLLKASKYLQSLDI